MPGFGFGARAGARRRIGVAARPMTVLAEGDSITAYSPTSGGWDSYARLWAADHSAVAAANYAVGGSQLTDLVARKTAALAYAPTHFTVLVGANDLPADTSTYLSSVLAYTDQFRSAGAKVFVGTVLPRTGVGGWSTRRASFNAGLRAAVGSRIDDVFDFDTCPIGVDGAENDSTKFADGLHPTAAGQAVMKRVYATMLNHWLGIANEPLDFAFAPQAAGTLDTDYDSPTYTVSGLYAGETRPYAVQTGKQVSRNGGAFVTDGSGTAANGDTFKVRNHSSTSNATATNVSLTIGATTATFTVTTAGAGSRDWVPTDLGAKLALWVRPEGLSGADGAEIATWTDASGNGRNLTGAIGGGGGKPTVAANGIGAFKVATFPAGGSAYFTIPSGFLTGRTSTATFFVARNVGGDVGAPAASWGPGGNDYWNYGPGQVYTDYGNGTRRDAMTPPGAMTSWQQYMLLSAPSDWRFAQNGTNVGAFTSNSVSLGTAPRVGWSNGIGAQFNGAVAEVIDLNAAPTTTEQQLVEGYLAWKYGLQGSLPSAHPYKSAKPTI